MHFGTKGVNKFPMVLPNRAMRPGQSIHMPRMFECIDNLATEDDEKDIIKAYPSFRQI